MAVPTVKARHRSKKRTFLMATLVLVIGVGAVGSVYAWRMVEAIVHAEKSAVVPLPPSDNDFAWGNEAEPTPTSAEADAPEDVGGQVGTKTPIDISSSDPLDVVVTPAATQSGSQLPTRDDPSRGSVIQDIIGASVGSDDPSRPELWGGLTDLNIMLLGVDRRPDGGDQNADVIIIAHVDLVDRKVSAISIPRDLQVEIPGVGLDKINSAYNYGVQANPESRISGVVMMRDTIESVFQVPIHGYILVDFDGFTEVIDAMGGVTLNVPEMIVDDEYPTEDNGTEVLTFLPGLQRMDGERALKYVRTRHQDSDDGRRERQLQVLRALFDQAKSFDSISNGFNIVGALGGSVQTSFYIDQQLALAQIGYDMEDADINLVSLSDPLIWGGYTDSGAWVYFSDLDTIRGWIRQSLSTEVFASASPVSIEASPSPISLP